MNTLFFSPKKVLKREDLSKKQEELDAKSKSISEKATKCSTQFEKALYELDELLIKQKTEKEKHAQLVN